MNKATQTPSSFGLRESPVQRRLEELAAELLGKEDALFFPTCTMCNQTAINIYCNPADSFMAESNSHCILSEGGAPAMLSGVMPLPVPGKKGVMETYDMEHAFNPGDDQQPRTSLIVLENTHNRSGGAILDEVRMEAFGEFAKVKGVPIHLDGARIFNAAVALGITAGRLACHADSVAVSLNKGLSAPMGAVLAGESAFIKEAVRVRQRLGGGWRPTDILAAAGIVALEQMVDRLNEDHLRARRLAEGIVGCHCIDLDLKSVQTNLIVTAVNHPVIGLVDFIELLQREGIRVLQFGPGTLRIALHWEIDDRMVERVIEAFHQIDSKR